MSNSATWGEIAKKLFEKRKNLWKRLTTAKTKPYYPTSTSVPGPPKDGGHSVMIMPSGIIKIGGIEYSQQEVRNFLFVLEFALQQASEEQ